MHFTHFCLLETNIVISLYFYHIIIIVWAQFDHTIHNRLDRFTFLCAHTCFFSLNRLLLSSDQIISVFLGIVIFLPIFSIDFNCYLIDIVKLAQKQFYNNNFRLILPFAYFHFPNIGLCIR